VKVHHIILLVWFIIFAGWLVRQFSEHNKRLEDQQKK
jgi:flagellar biogenesis protein FliO